jgi:hypothetical protein
MHEEMTGFVCSGAQGAFSALLHAFLLLFSDL